MPVGQYNNWAPNNWSNNGWQWNNQYQNMQQPQRSETNIIRVTGPESAKAYAIEKDSSVVLFDAANPIFYVKTTDDGGFPLPLRTFKFEEIIEQPSEPPVDTSNFATKDDLENLEKNITELKTLLEGLVS